MEAKIIEIKDKIAEVTRKLKEKTNRKMRGMGNAAGTLLAILVFVMLFYIVIIVRSNFKSAVDTSTLDNESLDLINNVDGATNRGLQLSGIAPVVAAAVFILGLVIGLIAYAKSL